MKEKYPEELKCCLCKGIMEKFMVSSGEYDYKCINKKCITFVKKKEEDK